MLLEISGEIAPEKTEMEPKRKQHPVVNVTGDENWGAPCVQLPKRGRPESSSPRGGSLRPAHCRGLPESSSLEKRRTPALGPPSGLRLLLVVPGLNQVLSRDGIRC